MDCELFDRLVIDRVFSELDDLTSGAVQRHVAHCSRCRSIESNLRATREVATLPTQEPPASFVEQVLALERATRTQLPWRQRVGRAVSVLAGYAMRPQLGMSALLLLMIGLSLFLLRTQPGEHELIHVTERGVPEGEIDPHADNAARNTPPGAVASAERTVSNAATKPVSATTPEPSPTNELLEAARRAFKDGRFALAEELAERVAEQGGADSGSASMLSAIALSRNAGCSAAIPRFEALRARQGKSVLGEEAAFRAAECHRETGHNEQARLLYTQLQSSSTWGQQAREHLRQIPAAGTEADATDGGLPSTTP
jgi:hypothetical protein